RSRNQDRVAELVRAEMPGRQLVTRAIESTVVGEGAEQLVVTRAALVNTGENRVDDTERALGLDTLGGNTSTRAGNTIEMSRVFERADDSRADGDDAPASHAGGRNRPCGACWNLVGFLERQSLIQLGV